jgi:hypothetical protein
MPTPKRPNTASTEIFSGSGYESTASSPQSDGNDSIGDEVIGATPSPAAKNTREYIVNTHRKLHGGLTLDILPLFEDQDNYAVSIPPANPTQKLTHGPQPKLFGAFCIDGHWVAYTNALGNAQLWDSAPAFQEQSESRLNMLQKRFCCKSVENSVGFP